MSLQVDDALTLVDILDQVSRPMIVGAYRPMPHTGSRESEHGARPPEKEHSHPPEGLLLMERPTQFLYTLGEHLKGGQHRSHFRTVRRCLEGFLQREPRVCEDFPHSSSPGVVRNQAGSSPALYILTGPLMTRSNVYSEKSWSGGVSRTQTSCLSWVSPRNSFRFASSPNG